MLPSFATSLRNPKRWIVIINSLQRAFPLGALLYRKPHQHIATLNKLFYSDRIPGVPPIVIARLGRVCELQKRIHLAIPHNPPCDSLPLRPRFQSELASFLSRSISVRTSQCETHLDMKCQVKLPTSRSSFLRLLAVLSPPPSSANCFLCFFLCLSLVCLLQLKWYWIQLFCIYAKMKMRQKNVNERKKAFNFEYWRKKINVKGKSGNFSLIKTNANVALHSDVVSWLSPPPLLSFKALFLQNAFSKWAFHVNSFPSHTVSSSLHEATRAKWFHAQMAHNEL